MEPLRVIELFSGIGSQTEALTRAGIPHEVVATSDICDRASLAYEILHGSVNNMGDIAAIERLPECDLLTYSFPCQDLSNMGEKRGMEEGSNTRSSLLWQVGRLLNQYVEDGTPLPEVLLMENVKGILNVHNKPAFDHWVRMLSDLGYTSSYKNVFGSDYGMPQARERIIMVSTLTKGMFKFPDPFELDTCIEDYLDDPVDTTGYYIRKDYVDGMELYGHNPRWDDGMCVRAVGMLPQPWRASATVYDVDGVCPTIRAQGDPPRVMLNYNDVVSKGAYPQVRELTPRECWKLTGFSGEDYDAVHKEIPKSRMRGLVGNSIIVNVLMAVFKGIYIDNSFYEVKKLSDY